MLKFLVLAVSGIDVATQKILSQNEGIISTVCKFLPGFGSVNPFNFFPEQSAQLRSLFSKAEAQNALMFFSNIAACSNSALLMLKHGILDWYVAASAYNDIFVHAEVAIYLFNLVARSEDEQLEILLEKNLLIALNNVIREAYSHEAE